MASKGFTLLETLVALAVGGLLVLLAHQTFSAAVTFQMADRSIETAHQELMVARQRLASVLGSVDAAGTGFQGSPTSMAFATLSEAGPRRAQVLLRDRWLMLVTAQDTTRLVRAAGMVSDYLQEHGAAAPWVAEWHSPVSAPIAVRLRIERPDRTGVDTLLFVIGGRG